MNKLSKILRDRKGMTLVETVVAFVIAGLLIAATGALIISGLNLFNDTAARSFDKQIGDSTLDVVQKQLKYARSVTPSDGLPQTGTAGAIFVGTAANNPGEKGILYMKKTGVDSHVKEVFPEDGFYSGRTVSIGFSVEKKSKLPKAVTIMVNVYDGNDVSYRTSTSVQLLNSGESDFPTKEIYESGKSYGYGKVLVFTPLE